MTNNNIINVLLVEDNPVFANVIRQLLGESSHSTSITS